MLTLGPIAFTAPWLLVALLALPLLWWLLRVTPPAPKRQSFPAIRLLQDIPAPEETPARTPWWLLALRLAAAALIVIGLARPVWNAAAGRGGQGPLLIAIDDGWAAAADWPARLAATESVLEVASREGRRGALLLTAPPTTPEAPRITALMPARIDLIPVSVNAFPSNGRITMMSTFLLISVSTWLICWLTSLVPSTASRVTSL